MNYFSAATVLLLGSSIGAFAQCSNHPMSAHKEASMSSAVVVATVTAATPVPEAWDFLDGVNYTIHVDSKIHGHARANTQLTVFSENIPNNFEMYVGHQYVLYLQPQYDRVEVKGCGNSHATEELNLAKDTKQPATRGF